MCKLSVISQERLKIEVKLLLSAIRKSYMPRQLAQQQILDDLEWPFHVSRTISAVAESLVINFPGIDDVKLVTLVIPSDNFIYAQCDFTFFLRGE